MIRLLIGENSFEIDRHLERIIAEFDGRAEKIDGSELELRQIPDLLMGASLFAEKRLVIIKSLSENKAVWANFGEWLPRVSDDIQLVLVEPKPDKRTKTFKDLQKVAEVREFKPWGERDQRVAEEWAVKEAKTMGINLTGPLARKLIERTGIDQWRGFHALEKFAVLKSVTAETIEEIVDPNPTESIFQLFETALRGDIAKLHTTLQVLELSEEAYQLFALMSGQAYQLMVLAASDKPSSEVARDIGAHPFVLSKLSPYAKKLGRPGAKKVIAAFAEADLDMKTSAIDPWVAIERALLKITAL
jgi:DNA polymerase III delta subunit